MFPGIHLDLVGIPQGSALIHSSSSALLRMAFPQARTADAGRTPAGRRPDAGWAQAGRRVPPQPHSFPRGSPVIRHEPPFRTYLALMASCSRRQAHELRGHACEVRGHACELIRSCTRTQTSCISTREEPEVMRGNSTGRAPMSRKLRGHARAIGWSCAWGSCVRTQRT